MKILVLGIGNVMFSDEGIGVHLCKLLEKNYTFRSDTHTITFIDGGTLAMQLIPIIVKYDYAIIIDCIDAKDGNIGDVYFFDYNDMPKKINWSGSAHEVEMLQTLQYMELMGDIPKTKIVGIIPKRIVPLSFEISSEIRDGVNLAQKTILKHLKDEFKFNIIKKNDKDIQDIANLFSKGEL
ncbi:HyaD/HybD family hydrogenase maturation endopeptidase [Campylobacter sp. RM12327]|uniref:HyaD/HybD family hydrogenase maturation endopeptidase n=1 Tax=Campylobacter sputorum TaxID=206 RepID=UPI000B78F597|nr:MULTISPECIES: HyaD/HybD family hydrogenase maturation endopeptidase [Campylobacter]MBE7357416.1 HyaD/HybD family hydrogenase maturation endopeptidase [Campylobacter sp. RM11302]MBF6668726.1 HyaD/HybD family hydrogenase maturation endopeptidase [Campylobacter sp. RM12327]MBF6674728.1 HyaD/HybD family hydrogenase maturation endopeptidase [Campylobacter sp. RM13538]MBF6675955.1 HyaD/HybD family hydrogenase maturation endopeptidase [Campylobacter sp. RM12321]MBF6677787.1 HyaD/HybD family hydrog